MGSFNFKFKDLFTVKSLKSGSQWLIRNYRLQQVTAGFIIKNLFVKIGFFFVICYNRFAETVC